MGALRLEAAAAALPDLREMGVASAGFDAGLAACWLVPVARALGLALGLVRPVAVLDPFLVASGSTLVSDPCLFPLVAVVVLSDGGAMGHFGP